MLPNTFLDFVVVLKNGNENNMLYTLGPAGPLLLLNSQFFWSLGTVIIHR